MEKKRERAHHSPSVADPSEEDGSIIKLIESWEEHPRNLITLGWLRRWRALEGAIDRATDFLSILHRQLDEGVISPEQAQQQLRDILIHLEHEITEPLTDVPRVGEAALRLAKQSFGNTIRRLHRLRAFSTSPDQRVPPQSSLGGALARGIERAFAISSVRRLRRFPNESERAYSLRVILLENARRELKETLELLKVIAGGTGRLRAYIRELQEHLAQLERQRSRGADGEEGVDEVFARIQLLALHVVPLTAKLFRGIAEWYERNAYPIERLVGPVQRPFEVQDEESQDTSGMSSHEPPARSGTEGRRSLTPAPSVLTEEAALCEWAQRWRQVSDIVFPHKKFGYEVPTSRIMSSISNEVIGTLKELAFDLLRTAAQLRYHASLLEGSLFASFARLETAVFSMKEALESRSPST